MKPIIFLISFILSSVSSQTQAEQANPEHLSRYTEQAHSIEKWRRGTTKRFDTFEQFFLSRGLRAFQRVGYLYDVKKGVILKGQEAVSLFPNLKEVLQNDVTEIILDEKALISFVNINLPAQSHSNYLFLYFDLNVNEQGNYGPSEDPNMRSFLERTVSRRQLAAKLLQAQKTIPWYLIQVPTIGLVPQ